MTAPVRDGYIFNDEAEDPPAGIFPSIEVALDRIHRLDPEEPGWALGLLGEILAPTEQAEEQQQLALVDAPAPAPGGVSDA
jgi:hypothetical protein